MYLEQLSYYRARQRKGDHEIWYSRLFGSSFKPLELGVGPECLPRLSTWSKLVSKTLVEQPELTHDSLTPICETITSIPLPRSVCLSAWLESCQNVAHLYIEVILNNEHASCNTLARYKISHKIIHRRQR